MSEENVLLLILGYLLLILLLHDAHCVDAQQA